MIVNTGDWIWFAKIQSKSECHKQEDKKHEKIKTNNFSLADHILQNLFRLNPEYPDQIMNKIPIKKG